MAVGVRLPDVVGGAAAATAAAGAVGGVVDGDDGIVRRSVTEDVGDSVGDAFVILSGDDVDGSVVLLRRYVFRVRLSPCALIGRSVSFSHDDAIDRRRTRATTKRQEIVVGRLWSVASAAAVHRRRRLICSQSRRRQE